MDEWYVEVLDWPDRLVCWRCMTFVETNGHGRTLLPLMQKNHEACANFAIDVESGKAYRIEAKKPVTSATSSRP